MRGLYRTGLIGAFVLQVALLGYMIADRAMLLTNGKEIRLAVIPVDPRDMVRGDYVTLSYDISRIHSGRVLGDGLFVSGQTVFVTLEEDAAGAWKAVAMHERAPASGTYLRGVVERWASVTAEPGDDCSDTHDTCSAYDIAYNIEQFFVPEGTGREIEAMRNDQRVAVDVAVAGDGRAALKRLLIDGKVTYDEPLFW